MKISSCFSFILFLLLISFSSSTSSSSTTPCSRQQSTCMDYTFVDSKRVFSFCNDLPVLDSFLYWNYDTSTRMVDIAYRHTGVDTSTWVSWAINPASTHMIGSQALVAFQGANGTIHAYTSPITSYSTSLEEGPLSFPVNDISATFANNEIIIYATFELPNNVNNYSSTIVNHLWQDGPLINGETPGRHRTSGPNVLSTGTIDFSCHTLNTNKGAGIPKGKLKNVHGVFNAVSWGFLMPLGAILARYLKPLNLERPIWFYLHIFFQSTAYLLGVLGGWATGLILRSKSSGIQYDTHRNFGIVLFTFATLQVLASGLKPKPDHKYKLYWNINHRTMGYIVIVLGIINVFKGIEILDPNWKNIYIGVIVSLGVIALVLDSLVMNGKKSKTDDENTEQA